MMGWSEEEDRYLESIKRFPEVRAVLKELKNKRYEFSEDDLREAERMLAASCGVLMGGESLHPSTIKKYMTGFSNGYGCWLGAVREAIDKAEIESERDRDLLIGAFEMAKAYLFDIEGYNPERD